MELCSMSSLTQTLTYLQPHNHSHQKNHRSPILHCNVDCYHQVALDIDHRHIETKLGGYNMLSNIQILMSEWGAYVSTNRVRVKGT